MNNLINKCLLFCVICLRLSAGQNGNFNYDILQRIEDLEKQQRQYFKIESLEKTVNLQTEVIEYQARTIESLERKVSKDDQLIQVVLHSSRYYKLKLKEVHILLLKSASKHESEGSEIPKNSSSLPTGEDTKRQPQMPAAEPHIVNSKHKQKSTSLIKKTNSYANGHDFQKRQETGGISFSVYLDHDVQFGAHQTIKFNQVIINDGNEYSPHSGVFTCPEDGVCMLSFSIGQRSEHGVSSSQAELIVDSYNVIDAAADAFHASQDLQGGNTVVKRLKQGDLVWVDSRNSGNHAEGSSGFRLTSFSGVYLYP